MANELSKTEAEEEVSVLKVNENFLKKILGRKSSVGHSSRYSVYHGAAGKVPFQWETIPGTPKNPPKDDNILPPLKRPPAFHSLDLSTPGPCISTKPSRFCFTFWKKKTKKKMIKAKSCRGVVGFQRSECSSGRKVDSLESTSNYSSSSSSSKIMSFSSAASSSNANSQSSKLHKLARALVKWGS